MAVSRLRERIDVGPTQAATQTNTLVQAGRSAYHGTRFKQIKHVVTVCATCFKIKKTEHFAHTAMFNIILANNAFFNKQH